MHIKCFYLGEYSAEIISLRKKSVLYPVDDLNLIIAVLVVEAYRRVHKPISHGVNNAAIYLQYIGKRAVNYIYKSEYKRNLDEKRYRTKYRVIFMPFVQGKTFIRKLILVVDVLDFKCVFLRHKPYHVDRVLLREKAYGEKQYLCEKCEYYNAQTVVMDQIVDQTHYPAENRT